MNQTVAIQPSLTEAAGLSTGPIPTRLYTDPAHFELERERIFRRAWLKVGREELIPKPGDYFVKDIDMFNTSVVLARGKDGRIRAMHNVCSHRGHQVVLQKKGHANRFTCRYHGWTYLNSGELVAVTDEGGFFDVDKKKCGLTQIACDVWEGWIFINMQPEPEVGLLKFLGPFAEAFSNVPYPYPDHAVVIQGEFKANWKAVADAFSEAYHIFSIHTKTFAPVYTGEDNPFSRPVSANVYGAHRSLSTWMNTKYQPDEQSAVERWLYPEVQTITGAGKTNEVNPLAAHPGLNPTKSEAWASDVHWVFPNWHIQMSANRFWSHEFWPTSVNTTKWECRFYQPRPTTIRERLQLELFTSQMADGMLEDVANIESTQRGLASGAKSFIHLQDGEILLRHSMEQIMKWTAATTVAEALA